MLRLYFKQAIEQLKQDRLFSGLYIGGTGLAIATTTIMAVILFLKVAPLYPEYNRSQIYYVENLEFSSPGNTSSGTGLSYRAVSEWFYTLKNAEQVSAQDRNILNEKTEVLSIDESYRLDLTCKKTDTNFFKIFSFKFIEGRPFSQAEFNGNARVVAISDAVAKKIFGTLSGVVGKRILLNQEEYKICGVYKEPSRIMIVSYAQVILPYTSDGEYKISFDSSYEGPYRICILCNDDKQAERMKAEVNSIWSKYNSSFGKEGRKVNFKHYPIRAVEKIIDRGETEFSWKLLLHRYGAIFIVLLIVPSLNLGGIISGRMETRIVELAVRKSFGATRVNLLKQLLWDNMLLTLAGGLFGFIITCLMLYFGSSWIFTMLDFGVEAGEDILITADMLFSPAIFLFSFIVCVILNILSSVIPAWNSLRRSIVESLNYKK